MTLSPGICASALMISLASIWPRRFFLSVAPIETRYYLVFGDKLFTDCSLS